MSDPLQERVSGSLALSELVVVRTISLGAVCELLVSSVIWDCMREKRHKAPEIDKV